jgi:hypothetical protein
MGREYIGLSIREAPKTFVDATSTDLVHIAAMENNLPGPTAEMNFFSVAHSIIRLL